MRGGMMPPLDFFKKINIFVAIYGTLLYVIRIK